MLRLLITLSLVFPSAANAALFQCTVSKSVPHTELENHTTVVGLSDDKLTVLSQSGASSVYKCASAQQGVYTCSSPDNGATFDARGFLSEIGNDGSWFVTHICKQYR